jgi:hypothetical protein
MIGAKCIKRQAMKKYGAALFPWKEPPVAIV